MAETKKNSGGLSLGEVLLIGSILMIIGILVLFPVFAQSRGRRHPVSAQNSRQMGLAGIMYGGDYDDTMPVTTNGWLSRMQNVADGHLTVDCPAPGTQDFPAKAAGGQRTDAWPILVMPYIKSRGLFVDAGRSNFSTVGVNQEKLVVNQKIYASEPKAVSDPAYDPEGATFRNQNRFPMYGMNYMYLSPLRIPKDKRKLPDAVNYAVSESHKFTEADDPSGTVYFTESQRTLSDQTRGFFVINAPGMWPAFANNKDGYVAFWTGTGGSGDWVGTTTACADFITPCPTPTTSTNFVYAGYNGGSNVSFLDGHVRYYKAAALAAGTDYPSAVAGSRGHLGSGAKIVDKTKYLWNLTNKNYYGQ